MHLINLRRVRSGYKIFFDLKFKFFSLERWVSPACRQAGAAIAYGEVPPEAEKPTVIMFFVYILQSKKFNRYYIGHSAALDKRLSEHNRGKVRSTKPYLPWEIVYFEEYPTKSEAYR
ncbi:MAG: GIY-YIG nuclease family protein, partial [Ignavibacteria bacterium]